MHNGPFTYELYIKCNTLEARKISAFCTKLSQLFPHRICETESHNPEITIVCFEPSEFLPIALDELGDESFIGYHKVIFAEEKDGKRVEYACLPFTYLKMPIA